MRLRLIFPALLFATLVASCSEKDPLSEVPKLQGRVSVSLEDGEAYHAQAPSTFHIPHKGLRENLKKGDIVKLLFRLSDATTSQVERMWVVVADKTNDGGYVGVLDNDPICTDQVKSGFEVKFQPLNVIDIWVNESKPKSTQDAKR